LKLTKVIAVTIISTVPWVASAQIDSLQYYFNESKAAYKAKDYPLFYGMIKKAFRLHPTHPAILYNAALASALTGRTDEGVTMLKKALHHNARLDLDHPDLAALSPVNGFQVLKELKTELLRPIVRSDTAFVIPDRSLHIECIAAGEKNDNFYVGSIHKRKIIQILGNRNVSDFTAEGQDGLTSVFGIKVDKKRKVLWACASPVPETKNVDSTERPAVFLYDLVTKKLIGKYQTQGTDRDNSVFGDIALDPGGKPFISDSKNNIIFTVNELSQRLEKFFTSKEFVNIQGITFSDNRDLLFIADYVKGIYALDLKTKKLTRLKENFEVSTKSIDGLTFYKNSLIAIQNNIHPMRVTKFLLNRDQNALADYRIIDKAHPAFNEPTIGCLRDDDFYYIANSLWSGYTPAHELKPADQLSEAVVLKVDMRSIE